MFKDIVGSLRIYRYEACRRIDFDWIGKKFITILVDLFGNFKTKRIIRKFIVLQPLAKLADTLFDAVHVLGTPLIIKAFAAIDLNNKANLFDQVDAFYFPFAGMQGVVRPGPNIDIYELKKK